MLQRSSHAPTQEIKQTPSSPRKRVQVAWSRGLVKISASWSCVGTWIKVIFPFSTLSLRKWYLTSMCLVLEWSTGFFATLMALVLSHWSVTWVYHEEPKKKTRSTKGRSRECGASTWKFTSPLADAKSLETLENERTDIPRTGCLASSPSSRAVTRSCFGTPSSPRVHLPHPHQEL
jgi:hypothetical protein